MTARLNPRGRLDVLAYRLIERLAARHCPREWPALAVPVWRAIEARLAPGNVQKRRRKK